MTRSLKLADASVIDTPDIQMIHQQAYDGLQKAFDQCDAYALAVTDPTFVALLVTNWSTNATNARTNNDLSFYSTFAETLNAGVGIPGYTDTWIDIDTVPTSSSYASYFTSFFKFAMSRLPRKFVGLPDQQKTSADGEPMILDSEGAPLSCSVANDEYMTYYDFHVSRLAQLVMSKVMFSLAMSAAAVQVNTDSTDGATPPPGPNMAYLQTIQVVVEIIEDSLSASLGDNTMSPNDMQNPENIYLTIKTISSQNLTQSQQVAALQTAIDSRRTTLQTALNAEMQVDGIVWWSGFWMWMWVVLFLIGLALIVHASVVGQHLLIYGALATIVTIQIIITVLNWFGYNGTLWDISGVNDSIAMSLGIPNLSNF